MHPDDLSAVKDDMVAFISGHGLRRMGAYVGEEVPTVIFEEEDEADGWKDFVEHAKSAGAAFITMSEVVLEPEDVAMLVGQLRRDDSPRDPAPFEDAQDLLRHTGKIGYLQLGFAHQGVMFLYETATEWYDQFQELMDVVGDFGMMLDDGEGDD